MPDPREQEIRERFKPGSVIKTCRPGSECMQTLLDAGYLLSLLDTTRTELDGLDKIVREKDKYLGQACRDRDALRTELAEARKERDKLRNDYRVLQLHKPLGDIIRLQSRLTQLSSALEKQKEYLFHYSSCEDVICRRDHGAEHGCPCTCGLDTALDRQRQPPMRPDPLDW